MAAGPAEGLQEGAIQVVVTRGSKAPSALTPLGSEEIPGLSEPSGFAFVSLFLITMIHTHYRKYKKCRKI